MSNITAVVIEADGTAYCIDVGTSVRELSGAINAPETVFVLLQTMITASISPARILTLLLRLFYPRMTVTALRYTGLCFLREIFRMMKSLRA